MTLGALSSAEYDLLEKSIDKIVQEKVQFKEVSDIPLEANLSDSNKACRIKASMLFVDIRSSSSLPERLSEEELVKLYRSYSRAVVQAIRRCGGAVRDFMGDGLLAIFVDDDDGHSEEKAFAAARYIATAIDFIVNPKLDESIGCRISCGIGINTGRVDIAKVGMRGREADCTTEAETGLVWIGDCTNLACKFSNCVGCEGILVSSSTYRELRLEEKELFTPYENRVNGLNIKGWLAESCYLEFPAGGEPCVALDSPDMCKPVFSGSLKELLVREREIGKGEKENEIKREILEKREEALRAREDRLEKMESVLNNEQYDFFCTVLREAFCKKDYICAMGYRFWRDNFENAVEAGRKLGKSCDQVSCELAYVMVSIYNLTV